MTILTAREMIRTAIQELDDALDNLPMDNLTSEAYILEAQLKSVQARVEFLEEFLEAIGVNPDIRWSVAEIAELKQATTQAQTPF